MAENIYLDHAATTPLGPQVLAAMKEVMDTCYGNPSSIHRHGREARILIEDARRSIARALNASLGEIYFTSSATEANNAILTSAVNDLGVKRIISSKSEHHCVLHTIQSLENRVEVVYLDLDEYGNIDHGQLEQLLNRKKTKTLVSLMHVNNEIGTVLDLERVSELCAEYGAYLHSDAVQSVGKMKLDLQKTKVNFLAATAHKLNGPKGCGFLYMNADSVFKPIFLGGSQERNMRAGTENLYGIAGFGKTMELWEEHRDIRMKKIRELRQTFKQIIQSLDMDIRFVGNQESLYAPHILSVSIPRNDKAEMIMMNLDIAGISASSGSACSSGSLHDSHVLEAISAPQDRKVIRFSFSYMNTPEEVKMAAKRFLKAI